MAAANFLRDVLEMFYGPIEENQRLIAPISPSIRDGFEIIRNNFNEWLCMWKMRATKNNKDLFNFFQKTKKSFINVCTNELETMKSVKIQVSLLVRFYMIRDEKVEEMNHYFDRLRPVILNEHNIDLLKPLLNQFIDEVKGEIEAWSERGSGWIMDKILEAFINMAQYQPMRGGSFMVLPTKLKNKKAILNIQNRDNECLRWAIRAALFPERALQLSARYTAASGHFFGPGCFDKLTMRLMMAANFLAPLSVVVLAVLLSQKIYYTPRLTRGINGYGLNSTLINSKPTPS